MPTPARNSHILKCTCSLEKGERNLPRAEKPQLKGGPRLTTAPPAPVPPSPAPGPACATCTMGLNKAKPRNNSKKKRKANQKAKTFPCNVQTYNSYPRCSIETSMLWEKQVNWKHKSVQDSFKTKGEKKTGRKMCMNFPSHQSKSISEICYLSTILTHKKQGIKQHEKHPNHRPSSLTRWFLHSLGRLMLACFGRQPQEHTG